MRINNNTTKIKSITSVDLKNTIVEGFLEGKANNVICLDLRKIDGAVSDYFIVAHGDSATHVEGINRAIYKKCISSFNEKPWKEEGKRNSEWILMDYVNVVAHIFYKEKRGYYNIEDLWGDAPREEFNTN